MSDSSEEGSAHTSKEEPFALNPAQAMGANLLQFSRKLHKAHFDSAIKSVCAEATDRFDLTQDNLHDFLSKVKRRAEQFSLSTIKVPMNMDDELGDTTNLASGHGTITEEHLQAFAQTFTNQQSWAAQDDHMLAQMLMNSCSEEAHGQLADHEEDFTVRGHHCGTLLLHVVVRIHLRSLSY